MEDPPTEVTLESLADVMMAYRKTALLRTAIELRVFDALAGGPLSSDGLAAVLETPVRSIRILLGALAAVGLLRVEGDAFALPKGGAELLVSSSPQYIGNAVTVTSSYQEWQTLSDLTSAVMRDEPVLGANAESGSSTYWVDFATNATFASRPAAAFMTEQLLPWAKGRTSLDVLEVGAGHGLFGFSLLQQVPTTRLWALDWPDVLDVTRGNAAKAGLADRVEYIPGDAFDAPLGGPYDVVILANFLFQFSERKSAELLRRVAAMIKLDGRIVIAGFTAGDLPASREYGARMVSLLMLLWTDNGEVYPTSFYERQLAGCGFPNVTIYLRQGQPHRVLVASR